MTNWFDAGFYFTWGAVSAIVTVFAAVVVIGIIMSLVTSVVGGVGGLFKKR